jgi:hypothetical protein
MAEEENGGLLKPPPSFQISRQLDQEKIDFLAKRVNDLLGSNNSLRATSSRNEKVYYIIIFYIYHFII